MSANFSPKGFLHPSGLRVTVVERPNTAAFAATLVVPVGSQHDPVKLAGISHFCEHMAFRGPNKLLSEQLGMLGANLHACTYPGFTQFTVDGHLEELELSLKFLANALQRAAYSEAEVELERQVFRHELATEDGGDRASALAAYLRYAMGDYNWHTSPKVLASSIAKFTPRVVFHFKSTHYRPDCAKLAIIAPRSADEVCSIIDKYVAQLIDTSPLPNSSAESRNATGWNSYLTFDRFPYTWVTVMHVADSASDKMRVAADIVADILCGGPYAELFRKLRTERPLAYDVNAHRRQSLSATLVKCRASVPWRSATEALDTILSCVANIFDSGISETQFESARRRLMKTHERYCDYSPWLASHLAHQALHHPHECLVEDPYYKTLATLSPDDANNEIRTLLQPNNRYVFVGGRVGPITRFRIKKICNRHSH